MTHPRRRSKQLGDSYPRLHLSGPHTLVQPDIYPRHLKGGQSVACFNVLDVVPSYLIYRVYERRRSLEAAEFLHLVFQEMDVPRYVRMDNEGSFCGGYTHPGVISTVVRGSLDGRG